MHNIINIPITDNPPKWQSSSPTPIDHIKKIHNYIDDYEDYNYCPELSKFLENKTIAYVAPSPHLKGLGMGEFIDSHDLVVRINQAYDMPEQDWVDYGRRTDIVVNCLNHLKRKALKKNMSFANSLKFIICPMINMNSLPEVDAFLETVEAKGHNVSDGYLLKIFEQVGTICNTGFNGIVTLLNYNIKSIYVTGLTFFNMGRLGTVYSNSYYDEAGKNNNFTMRQNREQDCQRFINQMRFDIHVQQPQIDYFKKILKYHHPDRLKIDDYLQKNFKTI
jgi:hypothetical protein